MKNLFKIITLLVLVFSHWSCNEELTIQNSNGKLRGKVVKKETNEPIANVKVFTTPSTQAVFTGTDGTFDIGDVPLGDYSVKAELTGYVTSYQAVNIQNEAQVVSIVFELSDDDSQNTAPTTPILLSPVDNAQDQPLSVELKWDCSDADANDVLKYKLIVKNNVNTDVIEVNDITTKNHTLSDLKYGVSYFWQISVNDGIHADVLSPTFKFTTTSTPLNRYHYVKKENGNYVIMSTDEAGSSFQLTSSSYNSWRPRKNNNANLIAYLRTDGGANHIYTAKPDGSDAFKVTQIPVGGFNNAEMDFSWSTNGNSFVYPYFDKLYKINKDGSGQELVYTTPDGSLITECDWSYDNSKVAIKTNNYNGYNAKIIIIDMLGNVLQTVLSSGSGASGGLNFSVDGQKLLYTKDVSGHEDANYRQLNSHVFIFNLATNTIQDISELSSKPAGTNDLDARFSPNNAQIILMNTSNDGISQKNVIVVTLGTTGSNFTRATLFSNAEMPDYE